jgi:hypothetical protein
MMEFVLFAGHQRNVTARSAQAVISASFFFARSACLFVMAPASTISSIFLSLDICFNLVFALEIFRLDVGNASL